MSTQPPPSDSGDAWPTREDATFVATREDVAPTGPPESLGPPPPDRRIGAGMLLGLAALALVAIGIVIAYLLTHRNSTQSTTTVVVTSGTTTVGGTAGTAAPTKTTSSTAAKAPPPATTTGATTNPERTTTDSTTTTPPTTTAAAPPTPANATVPDVGGSTEQQAADKLSAAGILPSLAFVPSSDPLGTVEQQAKPAGTVVPYHAHVQVNISKGPNATTDVTVPNTIGRTLSDAVSTLNAAGLRLIFVKLPITSRAEAGKIVQQSPLAGGAAPKNGQVLVFLGAYRSG